MSSNFKVWIQKAGIRAIKTFAQTFLSLVPMGAAFLGAINWGMALSAAALSAVLSLATSMAGLPEIKTDAPPDTGSEEV